MAQKDYMDVSEKQRSSGTGQRDKQGAREWKIMLFFFFFFLSSSWNRSVLTTPFVIFPNAVSSFVSVFFCSQMCLCRDIWCTTGFILMLGVVTWMGGPVCCFYGAASI